MDPSPLPSAKNRDFLLRIGSRYVGVLALLLHIPTMLVVEPVYWAITVLPSAVIGTMDFLVARVLARFGALAAAVFFLGIGLCQVTWLTLSLGEASGVQYYFF